MIFVDANVIVYAGSTGDDPLVKAAKHVIREIAAGSLAATTSPSVIEEVWHLELSGRVAGLGGAAEAAVEVLSPLVAVDEESMRRALALDVPPELGANDRLHVATCLRHEIPVIVSADQAFDAVDEPRRVDPTDVEALGQLLTS